MRTKHTGVYKQRCRSVAATGLAIANSMDFARVRKHKPEASRPRRGGREPALSEVEGTPAGQPPGWRRYALW
jgi:hypothetical protein